MNTPIARPPVASHADWLVQRLRPLEAGKVATRERERVAAERRCLPMVRIEKNPAMRSVEYNYRPVSGTTGEGHGLSVFFESGGEVFHAYSTYGRGVESLTDAYLLLDGTPYARQKDWEASPADWPQLPACG